MSAIDQIKAAQQSLKSAFDAYTISHKQAFDAIDAFCGVKKNAPAKAPPKTRKRVISATSEGDNAAKGTTTAANKKPKTIRKKKHPDQPTKPATGYLRFRSEAYQSIKARYPSFSPTQITSHIASLWNTLTDEQKTPYNEEYKQAKVQYDIEMTAFKDKLANQVEQVEQTPDIQVDAPAPAPAPVVAGMEKEKGKESKEERKKRKKEKREQKERDKLAKEKAQKKKKVLSKEMVTASDEDGDIPVN